MNEDGTYTIPAENLAGLQAKIAKLAKRADKLGVPAPTCTVVETLDIEVRRDIEDAHGHRIGSAPTGEFRRSYKVVVTGEAPCYNGWRLTAVIELDHEEPETPNVVGAVPDAPEADLDVAAWRLMSERCDHCGVNNRRRNKLVVVTHEDGEQKVVGSTCLKDFLGHTSPDAIASWAQWLADLDDVVSEFEGSFGGGETRYDPTYFLAWVVRAISEGGWVSRGTARTYDKTATADQAVAMMRFSHEHPNGETVRGRFYPPLADITEAETAKAAAAWEWAATQGGNDYLDNLAAVAAKASLRSNHLGIAASAVSAYDRAQGREIERKARAEATANSTHFGAVGERLELAGTVTFVKEFPGYAYDSPPKALVKILTTEGNVVTWWCSNAHKAPEQGDQVAGKATVKDHDTYEGTAQTVVTRAKLEVTEAAA